MSKATQPEKIPRASSPAIDSPEYKKKGNFLVFPNSTEMHPQSKRSFTSEWGRAEKQEGPEKKARQIWNSLCSGRPLHYLAYLLKVNWA